MGGGIYGDIMYNRTVKLFKCLARKMDYKTRMIFYMYKGKGIQLDTSIVKRIPTDVGVGLVRLAAPATWLSSDAVGFPKTQITLYYVLLKREIHIFLNCVFNFQRRLFKE